MADGREATAPDTHVAGQKIEPTDHDRGVVAACKALGHEGIYVSGATLKRAIAAYLATIAVGAR